MQQAQQDHQDYKGCPATKGHQVFLVTQGNKDHKADQEMMVPQVSMVSLEQLAQQVSTCSKLH